MNPDAVSPSRTPDATPAAPGAPGLVFQSQLAHALQPVLTLVQRQIAQGERRTGLHDEQIEVRVASEDFEAMSCDQVGALDGLIGIGGAAHE